MNILNWLQENLHIDGVIVLIVIAAGFFQNRYMKTIKVSKDEKTDSAWKTLIVSALLVTLKLVFAKANRDECWDGVLSYFLATSFYEIILRPVVKYINKNLGTDQS